MLQIRILDVIALEGELSKTRAARELHSHYSDVFDAFKALIKADLIGYSSSRFTSRRPEQYYKLTMKGLEVFINESSSPEQCWTAIIWLCILHRKQKVDGNFEKCWHFLEKKHSANLSVGGGHFQLDIFDRLFKSFLSDNEFGNQDHGVTNAQMVLECLAVNRSITLEEIVQKIRVKREEFLREGFIDELWLSNVQPDEHSPSIDRIKNIRDEYVSKEGYYKSNQKKLAGHNPEELLETYLDYLTHTMIVQKNNHEGQDGSSTKYELSLIGVMLVIALTRYVHVENAESQNLLYYNLPLIDYYNNIATNYQDKLPMVFKKWKHIGNDLFFDILVYEDSRRIFTHIPFYMGGNKELYDGIKGAASYANDKYNEIYQGGLAALKKMDHLDSDKKEKYLTIIKKKLSEIEAILKYADLQLLAADLNTFTDNISGSKNGQVDMKTLTHQLEAIEKVLSEELTLLLYLGQRTSVFISIAYPSMFLDSSRYRYNSLISQSDDLLRHAIKDKDLGSWLSEKVIDSAQYQKEALGDTSMRYKRLTAKELS